MRANCGQKTWWLQPAALMLALAGGGAGWAAEETAGPNAGNFYLSPGINLYQPAEGDDFPDGGGAIGLGYMVQDDLGFELLYTRVDGEFNLPGGEGDDHADVLWLNALHKMGGGNDWQPFVLWGFGFSEIDNNKDTEINVGVGFFGQLTPRWSVRGDLRAVHSVDEGGVEPFAFMGLSVALGDLPAPPRSPQPVSQPPPQPPLQPVSPPPPRRTVPEPLCRGVPAGAPVDADGCPLDSDGDGVPDYLDRCAGTAAGTNVDKAGCHIEMAEAVSMEVVIEFDFDSSAVRPTNHADISQIAEFMRTYADAECVLEGYADPRGTDQYNLRLSKRRADAVLKRLVEVEGIDASRLRTVGFGESQPLITEGEDEELAYQRSRRVVGKVDGTRMTILMK